MSRITRISTGFVLLFLIAALNCSAQTKWRVLFDGKSTDAWRAYKRTDFPSKCWTVEDGMLKTIKSCPQTERTDIVTKDKFRNFEFEYEWKISPGGNSGAIYLVSDDEDETWKTGPEMQVLDDDKHADGKTPKTTAGSLYGLIAATNKTLRPVGEFNKARIVVKNGHVEHWLNGKKIVEYDLGSNELITLIAQSKFKDYPHFAKNREGFIALQFHGDEVWYRNVRVRELPGN